MRFFYQGTHQHTCIEGRTSRSVFRRGEQLLALQQTGLLPRTPLMPTDLDNSVLEHESTAIPYSPYGHAELNIPLHFGFNGEPRDPLTGNYLLGNGYRAYCPRLLRFLSPDNQSPFLKGGPNAYAYVSGDPINLRDPSGHNKLLRPGRMPLVRYEGPMQFAKTIAVWLGFDKKLGITLNLAGHASKQKFYGWNSPFGKKPDKIATLVKDKGHDLGAQPILLLGCELGEGSFGQELANIAKTDVYAPTGPIIAGFWWKPKWGAVNNFVFEQRHSWNFSKSDPLYGHYQGELIRFTPDTQTAAGSNPNVDIRRGRA